MEAGEQRYCSRGRAGGGGNESVVEPRCRRRKEKEDTYMASRSCNKPMVKMDVEGRGKCLEKGNFCVLAIVV
jgi:hypothetical protein